MIQALRDWSRDLYLRIGAERVGSPKERWAALNAEGMPRIAGDIDMTVLRADAESFDFDVTGCRYADFFRQLGEPDLGAVLLCEVDDHVAEVGSPDVAFTRTGTIMRGAAACDFRYRLKP